MAITTRDIDEERLLAAYRASDQRGKQTTLARALQTASDYPHTPAPRLTLVPVGIGARALGLDAA